MHLNEEEKFKLLVELNVMSGVNKVREINYVKNDPGIVVHGWVYDLKDGILNRLD
jgi:carbonic anhydrase